MFSQHFDISRYGTHAGRYPNSGSAFNQHYTSTCCDWTTPMVQTDQENTAWAERLPDNHRYGTGPRGILKCHDR